MTNIRYTEIIIRYYGAVRFIRTDDLLLVTSLVHLNLYRSKTQGPEDDSAESKHVAPISQYMFNITTVVFDGPSPPFMSLVQHSGRCN